MKVIITGGAGFIGCNAASRFLKNGCEVVVIDNLSRAGAEANLKWLESLDTQEKLNFLNLDIREADKLIHAIVKHRESELILHLAAQVAVTSSVVDPRFDFEVNAHGTFNLLEAVRLAKCPAAFIYASTNKVYGGMEDMEVALKDGRYAYTHVPEGISEDRSLDFHSPYGCSKGSADQYVRDYHRIYGLPTVVLRQSCIYGYRQFGVEDQGWVAWFTIATEIGKPITIYGDGRQVRDVLFIEDLVNAFEAVYQNIDKVAGKVFNIGGGPSNVLSLLELIGHLEKRTQSTIEYGHEDWRPGDQRIYVSNISKAKNELGWSPKIGCQEGLDLLYDWVAANKDLFQEAS